MKKYKAKLWQGEPKENPFKVGDRVIYFREPAEVQEVLESRKYEIEVSESPGLYNWRMFRYAEKIKPREIMMVEFYDRAGLYILEDVKGSLDNIKRKIKFREVLEDE